MTLRRLRGEEGVKVSDRRGRLEVGVEQFGGHGPVKRDGDAFSRNRGGNWPADSFTVAHGSGRGVPAAIGAAPSRVAKSEYFPNRRSRRSEHHTHRRLAAFEHSLGMARFTDQSSGAEPATATLKRDLAFAEVNLGSGPERRCRGFRFRKSARARWPACRAACRCVRRSERRGAGR
jgi:hypothetical protein